MIAACIAIVALAAILIHREHQHKQQVDDLLQRIQAPQLAVMEHREIPEIRPVPFDDDEAFWASRETLNG